MVNAALVTTVFTGISTLIFWRKSDDRMALFTSAALLLFGSSTTAPVWVLYFGRLSATVGLLESIRTYPFVFLFYLFPDGHLPFPILVQPGAIGMIFDRVFAVLSNITFILIPIAFAIAILRYHLFAIDLIIRKTVQYTLISGLGLAVYLLAVGATSFFFSTQRDYAAPLLALIIVALIARPYIRQVNAWMDKVWPVKPRTEEEEIRD